MTLLGALVCFVAISGHPEVELLHFESPNCVHCRTMEPTVERLSKTGCAIRHIDTSEDPDTAAKYRVRGVPCFVVLVNGEERDRHEGTASFDRLNSMVVQARRAVIGGEESVAPASRPRNERQEWRSGNVQNEAKSSSEEFVSTTAPSPCLDSILSPSEVRQIALNSSVRIRIEERGQTSYGTGTMIDARNGEVLIITCGHLFRGPSANGKITVDVFVGGAKRTIPATLLDFDEKYEIGLISMKPGGEISTVRVADKSAQPEPGQLLFSVGCNGGADPTIMEMQVTAVDRFTGAPNIECTGSPVQGRSGGGLFDEQGRLVAICFGALGGEQRGAYSGLPTIHWQLAKLNLQELYEAPADNPPAKQMLAENNREETITEDRPAVTEPEVAKTIPRRLSPKNAGKLVPAVEDVAEERPLKKVVLSSSAPRTADRTKAKSKSRAAEVVQDEIPAAPKSPAVENKSEGAGSRSRLGRVLDDQLAKMGPDAEEAEVICIIKSKGSPTAKRKVLVLDNPSPEFLSRLSHEKQAQELFSNLPARKPAPAQVAKATRASGAKIAMRQSDSETGAQ